jgi:hypothetical protein
MPQWLSILIGILVGVAVVCGTIFFAIRPYVQAKPPKSLLADPTEGPQDFSADDGWKGSETGTND